MLEISIFIFLLLCSGLFSGSETAITAISDVTFAYGKTKTEKLAFWLSQNKETVIGAILVGNNIVNTALAVYAGVVFDKYFVETKILSETAGPIVSATLAVVFLLVFGEVVPKQIGVKYSREFVLVIAYPTYFMVMLLKPITKTLDFISETFVKFLPSKPDGSDAPTVQEVIALARSSEEGGHIDSLERNLMERSGKFNDIAAIDLMVPRNKVTGVSLNISNKELMKVFRETMYSRVPVYKSNIDEIVGIFNYKELLKVSPEEMETFKISDHMIKPLYIPENVLVGDLLERMRKTRCHMAIVLDEFSYTQGIVTMEDIQERVFGVINDEYDDNQPEVKRTESGVMEYEGNKSLQELSEELGIEFPPKVRKRVNTLNGFLTDMKGNFLKENDKFYFDKYCFTVVKMAGFRAETISITQK